MKKLNAFLVSALATVALNAAEANTAVIEQVIVRQQWPWSTDVKIEYKLKDVSSPVDVSVEAYNGDEKLDQTRLDKSLSGDRYGVTDVVGTIILDPVKAFGTEKVALANFKVKLSVANSSGNMTNVLYKIVDLASGEITDVRRADFYNDAYGSFVTNYTAVKANFATSIPVDDVLIWTDVTNNPIWKTDKLVLRRIPAGSWGVWTMCAGTDGGSSLAASEHLVRLTEDYYVGVFPVTQAQSMKIMGSYGSYYRDDGTYPDHLYKPCGVRWRTARSNNKNAGQLAVAPDADSFLGLLRTKVGNKLKFDLPTEAQWEFAARGGTMGGPLYSNGTNWGMESIRELAWCNENILSTSTATSGNAGYDSVQSVSVGRRYPNAFGLYDMLGNVCEYCLDFSNGGDFPSEYMETTVENPTGLPMSQATVDKNGFANHIGRGGSHGVGRTYCSLRSRYYISEDQQDSPWGFRVCCPIE